MNAPSPLVLGLDSTLVDLTLHREILQQGFLDVMSRAFPGLPEGRIMERLSSSEFGHGLPRGLEARQHAAYRSLCQDFDMEPSYVIGEACAMVAHRVRREPFHLPPLVLDAMEAWQARNTRMAVSSGGKDVELYTLAFRATDLARWMEATHFGPTKGVGEFRLLEALLRATETSPTAIGSDMEMDLVPASALGWVTHQVPAVSEDGGGALLDLAIGGEG